MRFRSRRVVTGGEVRPATIVVDCGLVVAIEEAGPADSDFGDLVIMPGLVDSHVHVNEPGRTEWEGFATATAAALAGGCTTIVDMPLNSIPPTVTMDALRAKQAAAMPSIACDVGFWGGYVGPMDQLIPLAEAGVCGFKSFLVDSGVEEFPAVSADDLEAAMRVMDGLGTPALVHAEDPDSLHPLDGDPTIYINYLLSRPIECEAAAVKTVSRLASITSATTHVLHVSSGEAAAIIGNGPAWLTGETCPHYLMLASEEVPAGATLYKCSPPIRNRAQSEMLWDALKEGVLSMVVSDHSPAPADLKATGDFSTAWGGISSLELRLPLTWTGARERGFGLVELTEWLALAPARLAGLDDRKGSLEVGKDADLVIWDPDEPLVVAGETLRHRHPNTPFEGMRLQGRVVSTLLRGEAVYDGTHALTGHGTMLERG
jgi:allantoinase